MQSKFSLKEAEVTWSMTSSSSGRGGNRNSRLTATTASRMTLKHLPTGVEVSGEVQPGHHSRAAMTAARAELRQSLHEQLRQAVARHLRIPGR